MPVVTSAGIIAGGSVAGGLISGLFGKSGANAQAKAAEKAAELAQQRYLQTRADLAPYNQTAQANLPAYQDYWKSTTQPMIANGLADMRAALPQGMTQAQLVNTPGYQFQLAAGQQAINNSQAAKGLGVSGQALKAAANWNSGLASSNYMQQFGIQQQQFANQGTMLQNALAGNNQVFGQLSAPVQVGESAAAQTGVTGANLANTGAQAILAGGQAIGSGLQNFGNALGGGIAAGSNAYGQIALMQALQNQSMAATPVNYGPYTQAPMPTSST